MPFFSNNKFSSKKIPHRKSTFPKRKDSEPNEDLKFEIDKIKLNIGDLQSVFEDGEWIPENGAVGNNHKENQRLKLQVQQLEAENNFLRLKTEVLLDMVRSLPQTVSCLVHQIELTETTAEAHIQDKEITRLRQELTRASAK